MYSAIRVVLVLCILEKCKGSSRPISMGGKKDVGSCYYDKCIGKNKVSDISCEDSQKITINSLKIRRITEDVCVVNCSEQDKCCVGGDDYQELRRRVFTSTYGSCSWKRECSFLHIGNAFTTKPNITLFVHMQFSCVDIGTEVQINMCDNANTIFQDNTYYHLGTRSNDSNRHCDCQIKSDKPIILTIVGRRSAPSAVLAVNGLKWGGSNQAFNGQHVLVAGETNIQLQNYQKKKTTWITINPQSGDGNVNVTCGTTADAPTTEATQIQTDSGTSTQKMSSKGTDDDAGFPVAAAVYVPLALVAVAAVIVTIIICCRFKQKSKDIYEGSNNKDPTVNQLDNPTYNEHDIDANQASIDVYNTIDTVDTKYTEFGDIDDSNDYLKPLDQRHKLSNGAGSRQQNGDSYDHLHTPGERVQTDGNYDHLDTKAPCNDDTYSHTDGGNGNSNGPLNNNTTSEDDTYNHLDNGVANAPDREHFRRTEEGNVSTMDVHKDKPKNQGEGNVYNELRPEDETVREAYTADRMPPHYEGLETAGDFASAVVYTDLRGVDANTPSPYHTLTSQDGQMDDKPNRRERHVMVDSQDGTVASNEYFTLKSNTGIDDVQGRASASHDYFTIHSDAALTNDPECSNAGHDYFTLKSDAALIDDPERNSAGHDYFTLKSDAALIDDPERNSAGHDYFTLKSDAAPIDDPDRSSACHEYFTLNSK